ncbi:hypothetical protein P691DRAFT_772566 [Macrolepiota fuliginosa MF-IS2]|uniref:DUF6534 domain-containing protein n=1 Tax=Macrolepiota fuliginosa MF-IS2 TaxID=1400762 RepID=A0A9P5XLV1_9AGAR|nr:hypothetical protein P691DRAFT_772566 [Macrolepiota fuliginosa MF-IS2]
MASLGTDIPDIGKLAGPPFIGIILNSYLYGILSLQYYNYHVNFRNDYPILRAIVHTQFVLETAQTIMSIGDGFHWFVYGYGKPTQLQEFFLANIDSPIICTCIALISQGAYCWRIYRLSGWKLVTLVIALIVCCQAAGGLGIGIVNQKLGSISKWNKIDDIFMIIWATSTAVADSTIAFIMTYLLLSNNSSSNRQVTVPTRIVRLIIESNVATATVAIVQLLTTVIQPISPPKTSLFLCPGYVLGKLYSNSFVSMLNNRRYAGGLMEEAAAYALESVALERRKSVNAGLRPRYVHTPGVTDGITVHTETAIRFDNAIALATEQNLKQNIRFSEV